MLFIKNNCSYSFAASADKKMLDLNICLH